MWRAFNYLGGSNSAAFCPGFVRFLLNCSVGTSTVFFILALRKNTIPGRESTAIMSDSPKRSLEESHGDKEKAIFTSGEPSSTTSANAKVAHDGHTVLIPQPSNDPNDPLNWSASRKSLSLAIIGLTAFLPDYGSSTGAITNLVQPLYEPLFLSSFP